MEPFGLELITSLYWHINLLKTELLVLKPHMFKRFDFWDFIYLYNC
jgi:hypothetical protein